MKFLLVKNWREHQHYKKRSPPWIKLHRAITEDYAFAALKDKTKAHLILIWILAAGSEGRIPHDPLFIAKRINAAETVDLDSLIESGFLVDAGDDGIAAPSPAPRVARATLAPFMPPDWVIVEKWNAWVKIRPAKARTPDALAAAIEKLEKFRAAGHDANEIVATSLANGWQGLFAPDKKNGGRPSVAEANKLAGEEFVRRGERVVNEPE